MDVEVIGATIGAVGALLAAVLPKGLVLWRSVADRRAAVRAHRETTALYLRRERAYRELRGLIRETRASRVLVQRSENGGGIPQAGTPVYLSVVVEDHDHRLPSIQADRQRRAVDSLTEDLLARVVRTGRARVVTAQLTRDTELSRLYRAQGVTRAELYRIGISTGRAVLFLSLEFTGEEMGLRPAEQVAIDNALARLRAIYAEDDTMITFGPKDSGEDSHGH